MDPHIFADPGPGSQNLADPTDPGPKHSLWSLKSLFFSAGGGKVYLLTTNVKDEFSDDHFILLIDKNMNVYYP